MENVERILCDFTTRENIVTHEFKCGKLSGAVLVHPDLSDTVVARAVIYALENCAQKLSSLDDFERYALLEYDIKMSSDKEDCINKLLNGDILLCVDGDDRYAIINARSYTTRGITEPPAETVMRGPREGFIEDLKTNLSLLERRLKTPDFAIDRMEIGRRTKTNVAVCYLGSVASPKVVKKIKARLEKIDIDGIVDSHYIVPYIEENPYSLFTQTGLSEKPDIIAAKLLEGRVAILVDGSPMVVTVPFLLIEEFQSGEDYYMRSAYSTFVRILRYLGLILASLLPALYVAMQNFHYTLIPVRFMITLMSAIKGLPLSPLAETVFVLLLFEIIREASVRMPRAVGMAMSIVGALVLGETAVNAGIISSPAVMITALSSIALFTVPNLIGPMSILRLVYTLAGGLCGLFGLILAVLFSLHYVCSLNAYDSPYLAPFAPLVYSDFKDAIEREQVIDMKKRPRSIPNINPTRQGQ
ncbi:MAG: spore germination protein [Clostridiales bacterium]|nr:spore germination protein [Clostridiales bacterium]